MKKKTIAYLLGAAAILCLVVGGVKLVREQKAGEEYEELREEAKTEEPETVEAEPEEEKEPLDIPVDFEACRRKIRISTPGSPSRAPTWITPSCSGRAITAIT
ncbi:MAG: hypothetical protein V8Q40_16875 [Anaerosacchariphilus sp.]